MNNKIWSVHEQQSTAFLDGLLTRIDLYDKGGQLGRMPKQNHSIKQVEKNHLGQEVDVLWMLDKDRHYGTVTPKNVFGLKLKEVHHLLEFEQLSDEVIRDHLYLSRFSLGTPSITVDTLLHAFLPFKHIDNTCPAVVASFACTPVGREICEALWGGSFIWIEETLPGFTQGKAIAEAIEKNPNARLVVIANNGLVTWGETSQNCYNNTINIIQEAEDFISSNKKYQNPGFQSGNANIISKEKRVDISINILPWIRGVLSQELSKILTIDDSDDVLSFVNSQQAEEISQRGALTPAQSEVTKPRPLFVNWRPETGVENLKALLSEKIEEYQVSYEEYFNTFSQDGEMAHDPLPNIILIPGLGMIATGNNVQEADNTRHTYRQTINIITKCLALNGFVALTPRQAFDTQHRSVKYNKTSTHTMPAEFDGKVVVITGAASGIGRGTAFRIAREGGHIVILDLNLEGGQEVADSINQKYGSRRSVAYKCDVGDEDSVKAAFDKAVYQYGGIDIVVNNAGIAYGAPIEQTSIKDWNLVQKVLTTGYFLISREAFRIWREQGIGGALVIVGSKNSIRAGKNIVAYSTAKAAELHMARCLAEEGGEAGIRVNSVLPDAVLKGASIFTDELRAARAKSYGIEPDQLEDYYIQRTTLKVAVYPEHIAEAIAFLASERASRTTGGVITVDGGVSTAYVR